jgi:hypothetical protein
MAPTALRRTADVPPADGGPATPSGAPPGGSGAAGHLATLPGSWILVAVAVAWNLISLRAETWAVSYLDDASLHEQMVRFATSQFRGGHFPLTSWFPFLGEGSPHFLHYQSLPAMVTGAVGLVTGSNAAFRWSLYLLWCLWPISVYLAGRLVGLGKWPSAAAAAMAPFLMSTISVGYEQKAYIWVGYGVWAQLWASWTLPLAWGFTWRAIRGQGRLLPAVVFISLTTALHFETGYLALLPLLLWPFVCSQDLRRRIGRAAIVGGGSLLACAWVIVPLLDQRPWAATNELLQATPLVNGYGAGKMLGWLVTGRVLDAGRFPVITLLAAVGLVIAIRRWREGELYRALVVVFVACLLLTFGRATFGSLVDLIPGSKDLFFRRFIGGVQLASLLFAGIGATWVAARIWEVVHLLTGAAPRRWLLGVGACAALAAVLAPAWIQLHDLDVHNTQSITAQRRADATQGRDIDRLAAIVRRRGDGRVYAGMPSNWGTASQVGAVPVFKYLESQDVDEVGYTLRTASLMTDPEFYFDDRNPSNYAIFGVRYLILPSWKPPPVPARKLAVAGPYGLWQTEAGGYVQPGRVSGVIRADRTNVGARSLWFLRSALALRGVFPAVDWSAGPPSGARADPGPAQAPGQTTAEHGALDTGRWSASVRMRTPGVAVLTSSFDPGWRATVDGRAARTRMVGPALVATDVGAGTHTVTFHYVGYGGYAALFAVGALTLVGLAVVDRRRRAPPAAAGALAVVLVAVVLAGCNGSAAASSSGTGNGGAGAGSTGNLGVGSAGATGSAGTTGTPGATGTSGATGASGATGTPGATGMSGATGTSGSTGAIGSVGSSGSSGSLGASGSTGLGATGNT